MLLTSHLFPLLWVILVVAQTTQDVVAMATHLVLVVICLPLVVLALTAPNSTLEVMVVMDQVET